MFREAVIDALNDGVLLVDDVERTRRLQRRFSGRLKCCVVHVEAPEGRAVAANTPQPRPIREAGRDLRRAHRGRHGHRRDLPEPTRHGDAQRRRVRPALPAARAAEGSRPPPPSACSPASASSSTTPPVPSRTSPATGCTSTCAPSPTAASTAAPPSPPAAATPSAGSSPRSPPPTRQGRSAPPASPGRWPPTPASASPSPPTSCLMEASPG